MKYNQVDVRTYHFSFKHINRSKLDPGREMFALRDTPHSGVRGNDDGAQAVPYPLPRLAVGVGIYSKQRGEGERASATPIRACANHVDADKKRDGRCLTTCPCVVHALPAVLPMFRWLQLLKNVVGCHDEDCCKRSDPVEAAAKQHGSLQSHNGGRG